MLEKFKEFKLSSLAVNNKISVYVLIVIIVIIGFTSYSSMPKESFPEIKQPTIYINTPYPGNSPVDMENLVTRPLEKEINTINGIKKLSSTSIQDFSIIIAEFDLDVESEEALQKVKDAVDKAKPELPNDLPTEPDVLELDFSDFPVMNINISGNFGYKQLKKYAEDLQDEIEELREVSEVNISGLQEEEVAIEVDRLKMEALQISFNDIENAIASENMTISGGDMKIITGNKTTRRSIRLDGEFKDYNNLGNVIVKDENQNIVYLRDIANITFGSKEPTSFARLFGKQVLTLDVKKKSGENLINAADKIDQILEKAKSSYLPKNIQIKITNDQSLQTKNMVSNLENSIILGVLLVVLVLLFFLGLRNSLFVGIAIPLSMLMGIAILNFQGSTLNMMVLFSLILALGMLVDNGIVVVENVYRLRSLGFDNNKASKGGVGQVALAIIASTATTVAAFMPLLFWDSLIGEFMKYLPITLIIVLSSSLFVALVINPVLTADYLVLEEKKRSARSFWIRTFLTLFIGFLLWIPDIQRLLGSILIFVGLFQIIYRFFLSKAANWFQEKGMEHLENIYLKTITWALKKYNPIIVIVGAFAFLFLSISIFNASNPKTEFFPENEPQIVYTFIETPLGSDIEYTDKITQKLEEKIALAIKPDSDIVDALLAQVGENTSDPNEGPQPGSSPHKSKITVSFLEYEKRVLETDNKNSTSSVMKNISKAVKDFPEAKVTVAKNSDGPPVGKPINVEVKGENLQELIDYVEILKKKMEDARIPGVDQLKTDLEIGKPMLEISVDRDAARRYGISTAQIGLTLRTALFGKEISKFKQGEDDYKIQLRYNNDYRYDLNNLMNSKITFRSPSNGQISQVPISAVTTITPNSTYGTVRRLDMERVINIFSEVEEGYNANEIVEEYKQVLKDAPIKQGLSFKFTGEQEEQQETMEFLLLAFAIAILVIFLIIVAQFNSVMGPFIILLSVLFSTAGVFLGFGLTGKPFVILMCGIGIISLAGVVVNNAIVLIDYTILLRKKRREELELEEDEVLPVKEIKESIILAGKTRLRPVLLTAITTILGLLPLAYGINFNFATFFQELDPRIYVGGDNAIFWGPMAWTVIYGLIIATFLTLIAVPVMYWLSDRLILKLKK